VFVEHREKPRILKKKFLKKLVKAKQDLDGILKKFKVKLLVGV